MTDEYLKFRGVHRTAEHKLPLIKQCMKKITRKDSVLKITELIGKNK